MNVNTGKQPIAKFRGFNGLWARGSDQTCPQDHLTDCYNCIFPAKGEVYIRENFTVQNDIPGRSIISYAVATLAGGPVLLTLNTDGTFYDDTHGTFLGNFPSADDFTVLCIYGRAYISFKENGYALAGGNTYWYDGITFSTAGWPDPGLVLLAPSETAVGVVPAGKHLFAVSFISPTGFVSKPSSITTFTSTGAHNVHLNAVPFGPAGTIGRVILASIAGGTELFFVPGGQINDNTTLTFDYNEPDTALVESADYLNNILSLLPSCAALKFYSGRMILIGHDGAPDDLYVSGQNDPETIDLTADVIHLPVDVGLNTCTGGLVIRKTLYITKPNGTYSVEDNGGNPGTWEVDCIDSALGAFDSGLSVFASSMSAQDVLDSSLIVHKRGLLYFNGSFADPPLTYKIESIWQMIDSNTFFRCQIAHDTWNKRVYIAVPLIPAITYGSRVATGATINAMILMMDYKEGLDFQSVKWSIWTVPGANIRKILFENFTLNYSTTPAIYQLTLAQAGTTIVKLIVPNTKIFLPPSPDLYQGGLQYTINQYVILPPVSPGGVNCFTMMDIITNGGWGLMGISLYSRNRDVGPLPQRGFDLGAYLPAMNLQRLTNFTSEGVEVQFTSDQTIPNGNNGAFWLTGLDVYGNFVYNMRPALVEKS